MPEIENDGATIHYRIDGPADAPVLMFSNSLATNLGMWAGQVEDFAGRYRVVRYDSRGHGQSTAPAGPYSIEMLGRDAIAVMDAVGAEKVRYCGLSKGGMVGMWLGANAPERLEKLVLSNTSPFMAPKSIWDERTATAREKGMAALAEATLERWFTPAYLASETATVDKIRQMILSTPVAGFVGCCGAIREMDQRESIRTISVPTMVIVGADDPGTTPDIAREIHDSIVGSELVIIDDAAHLSNIQQRSMFSATIARFFG